MTHAEQWHTTIDIAEHDDHTEAVAHLRTRDTTWLQGHGTARRNPVDRDVPEIGAELAAARALADLHHRLIEAVVADIEQATGQEAHLSR